VRRRSSRQPCRWRRHRGARRLGLRRRRRRRQRRRGVARSRFGSSLCTQLRHRWRARAAFALLLLGPKQCLQLRLVHRARCSDGGRAACQPSWAAYVQAGGGRRVRRT
jgi:hypothetical protein